MKLFHADCTRRITTLPPLSNRSPVPSLSKPRAIAISNAEKRVKNDEDDEDDAKGDGDRDTDVSSCVFWPLPALVACLGAVDVMPPMLGSVTKHVGHATVTLQASKSHGFPSILDCIGRSSNLGIVLVRPRRLNRRRTDQQASPPSAKFVGIGPQHASSRACDPFDPVCRGTRAGCCHLRTATPCQSPVQPLVANGNAVLRQRKEASAPHDGCTT